MKIKINFQKNASPKSSAMFQDAKFFISMNKEKLYQAIISASEKQPPIVEQMTFRIPIIHRDLKWLEFKVAGIFFQTPYLDLVKVGTNIL